MSISLICACKNRIAPLKVSLASWLCFPEIKEIIIVNWSSDNDKELNELIKLSGHIKIINVFDEKYFNIPQPLNLAASVATQEYILKMDSDYILNPYFNFFDTYPIDDNTFICGQPDVKNYETLHPITGSPVIDITKLSLYEAKEYINSISSYFKYLRGLLFVKRDNFIKVGGYNENLGRYYAFEDDELSMRLELLGLTKVNIKYDHSMIHIPHQDIKRIENFEGYDTEDQKKYLETVNTNEEKWDLEYFFAQEHIQNNKKEYEFPTEYYSQPKYSWNITKVEDQIYYAKKQNISKLSGFPKVTCISLSESKTRRDNIIAQFKQYDSSISVDFLISERFDETQYSVSGEYVDTLNSGTKGCAISHIQALKKFVESDEEYMFVCEDDLSLKTVQYWDFDWKTIVESLPNDWDCIQLLTIRDTFNDFNLRMREWNDWGATAYLIKKEYAKTIVNEYTRGQEYILELPIAGLMPLVENLLFLLGKVYTIPLFVEEVNYESTFVDRDHDVQNGSKNNHVSAHDIVLNYWKNKARKKPLSFSVKTVKKEPAKKTELEELLTTYCSDVENATYNFNLGLYYQKENQNAAAFSFFLRTAERSNFDLLTYQSLILGSNVYDSQGTRDGTAKAILQQAMCLLPERPEARFLLSQFSEKRQWWQDSYIYAKEALEKCNFDVSPLDVNVGYPGRDGLHFQQALAAWWWGKIEESSKIFNYILTSYPNSIYTEKVLHNLKYINNSIN